MIDNKDGGMQDKWLVLFDIDGTLLYSGGCGRAATRLAIKEVFGSIGSLDGLSFAGKTDWQILLEALGPVGVSARHIKAHIQTQNTAVGRHLDRIIADFPVAPCEGALDLVAALRDDPDVLLGLVTGNMAALVPIKLRAAGFNPSDFKIAAFGSEGWDRSMLPPLALERAQAYSGVDFAPDRIVIVGDTPNDIDCAASIGARTIAVATGPFDSAALRAHNPTYTFESLADRNSVLAAIFDGRRRS